MLASLNVFSVAHEHNRIRVVKSSSVVKSRFLNFFFFLFWCFRKAWWIEYLQRQMINVPNWYDGDADNTVCHLESTVLWITGTDFSPDPCCLLLQPLTLFASSWPCKHWKVPAWEHPKYDPPTNGCLIVSHFSITACSVSLSATALTSGKSMFDHFL